MLSLNYGPSHTRSTKPLGWRGKGRVGSGSNHKEIANPPSAPRGGPLAGKREPSAWGRKGRAKGTPREREGRGVSRDYFSNLPFHKISLFLGLLKEKRFYTGHLFILNLIVYALIPYPCSLVPFWPHWPPDPPKGRVGPLAERIGHTLILPGPLATRFVS